MFNIYVIYIIGISIRFGSANGSFVSMKTRNAANFNNRG